MFGLRFDTKRNDILLAVLEGITFEQALSLEALSEAAGPVESLRAIGGGTRSALWLQMKADILNRPLTQVAVQDGSCLAAAILGRWAIDPQQPIAQVTKAMVATGRTFHPRPNAMPPTPTASRSTARSIPPCGRCRTGCRPFGQAFQRAPAVDRAACNVKTARAVTRTSQRGCIAVPLSASSPSRVGQHPRVRQAQTLHKRGRYGAIQTRYEPGPCCVIV